MGKSSDFDLRTVPVDKLRERAGENPNMMEAAQFGLLVRAIQRHGFLQPVTVRKVEGGFEVVDGHHRLRAAQEAGLEEVPVLVTESDDMEALAEMLALNRLRGEMDLGRVSAALHELAEAGFEDLTATGFAPDEIESLLRNVDTDALTNIGEGAGGDDAADVEVVQARRHAIRLLFDRPEDRDLVRAVALSNGVTVEAGILSLCREKGVAT